MPPVTLTPPPTRAAPEAPANTVPGIAPTPAAPYNPADHIATGNGAQSSRGSPALTDALNRLAGAKPGQPSAAPANTPKPAAEPAAPAAKPAAAPATTTDSAARPADLAAHVKFVPSDERTAPATTTAAPTEAKTDAAAAAAVDVPPEVLTNANSQLRTAYEKLKEDFATRAREEGVTKRELADFRAKATAYEDRIKALEPLEAKAKALEAQWLAADEQLRITNYVQHPEFHERYVKPVADSIAAAHELVGQVTVDDNGTTRLGNATDFDAVLRAPNLTEASRVAKELFGPDLAPTFVQHRQSILTAERARAGAARDAATRATEWVRTESERAATARTAARDQFTKASADLAARYATVYLPADGDTEAAEARRSGEALANIVVEGRPPEMDERSYLSTVAKVWHRASAMPMTELRLTRALAEVDTLKARLAKFENSTPTAGGRGLSDGTTAAPAANDANARMHAELSAIANRRR